MSKTNEKVRISLEHEMFNAYLNGARTQEHYFALGFTAEEIAAGAPGVARRARELQPIAA